MKKVFALFTSGTMFFISHGQNTVPADTAMVKKVQEQLADNAIAAKSQGKTVSVLCNGLKTGAPQKIISHSGASGYYNSCTIDNNVIIYLVGKKTAVFNYGNIRIKYGTLHFEKGSLGFPVADVKVVAGSQAAYQTFEGGRIYEIFNASPDKKTSALFIIQGDFYKKFMQLGGDAAIGLPISDEEDDRSAGGEAGDKPPDSTISQSFEKGVITKKGNTVKYTAY
jgi:hypothetical protein